jgi:hypothetical protein
MSVFDCSYETAIVMAIGNNKAGSRWPLEGDARPQDGVRPVTNGLKAGAWESAFRRSLAKDVHAAPLHPHEVLGALQAL